MTTTNTTDTINNNKGNDMNTISYEDGRKDKGQLVYMPDEEVGEVALTRDEACLKDGMYFKFESKKVNVTNEDLDCLEEMFEVTMDPRKRRALRAALSKALSDAALTQCGELCVGYED